MNGRTKSPELDHLDLSLLLPWYLNDTLSRAERRAVEEHLGACAGCRQELEELSLLRQAVHDEAEPAPSPEAVRRLMERVGAYEEGRRGRAGRRGLGAWLPAFSLPRPLAAAALGLLVIQAAVIATLWLRGPGEFRALTAPPAPGEERILIAFEGSAPERAIRELLLGLEARVVEGPSPLGVYRLELPAGADPEEVIARLREARGVVRFVALEEGAGPPRR